MDKLTVIKRVKETVIKYRYALIVLAVGVIFMLLPVGTKRDTQEVITKAEDNILTTEEQLSVMLSMVEGAGKVQVMLTLSTGEEIRYQSNEDTAITQDSTTKRTETVTVTAADRAQSGLVKQINPPSYLGALVICQGADSPLVRLAVIEAVAKLTGLGTDKIAILKMK